MATDAFEMALIHRVFRRELAHAPDLIRSVVAGDTKRSKVVSAHLCNIFSVLHHHRAAEDDLLWPMLRARLPLRVQDVARMQEEHRHRRVDREGRSHHDAVGGNGRS